LPFCSSAKIKVATEAPLTDTVPSHNTEQSGFPRSFWLVLLASLLPIPVIWFGMNVVKNAVATYALYHYLCLLPAIIWGYGNWRRKVVFPSILQIIAILVSSAIFCFVAVFAYTNFGDSVLSSQHAMDMLNEFGYTKELVIPLGIYIVVINPILEELFWRGVVLEKLDSFKTGFKYFGIIWSSVFYGALHYPILQQVMYSGWAEFGAANVAIFGVILAYIYRKTNSIIMPILVHSLITDLAFVFLMIAMFKRLHVPGW
jgi:membrane protease YdiL (CAAX protease family)